MSEQQQDNNNSNNNNISDGYYSVKIDESFTENQILQRFRSEVNRGHHHSALANNEFSLHMCLSDNVLEELCFLFDNYATRRPSAVQWKALSILSDGEEEQDYDTTLLYHALRIANEASLFATMELHFSYNLSFRRNGRNSAWVLPSLQENHRLTNLNLSLDFDLSVNDTGSLCRTLEDTQTLTDLVLDIPNAGDFSICGALALNRTLKTVSLTVKYERDAKKLCRALQKNPNLKSVTLNTTTESNLMESSIRILLNSKICRRLETLHMNYCTAASANNNSCSPLEIDELIPVLSNHQSLKSFGTNRKVSGERPFSRLLHAIKSHPTLESLHLHQRFDIEDIQHATTTALQFPRRIQLSNPKFAIRSPDGRYETALQGFLEAHPKVSFSPALLCHWPQCIAYTNHLNLAGRHLMRQRNLPLGLWPIVLHRIGTKRPNENKKNKDDYEKYRASVVYEFLHGPALVGRGA